MSEFELDGDEKPLSENEKQKWKGEYKNNLTEGDAIDIFEYTKQTAKKIYNKRRRESGKIYNSIVDFIENQDKPKLLFRFAFVIYLLLAFIIYFKNPFNIMDLTKGYGIIIMVGIGAILASLGFINGNNTFKGILNNVKLFLKLTGVIFLCIFTFSLILKSIMNLQFLANGVHTVINTFIVIFCLCLIYLIFHNQTNKKGKVDIFTFLKKVIFYIPCLIIDIINYLKKDYKNTPRVSFIIFALLLVFIVISIILPKMILTQLTQDGVVLLKQPLYLNEKHSLITQQDLNKKMYGGPIGKANNVIMDTYNQYFGPSKENYENKSLKIGEKVYDYDTNRFIDLPSKKKNKINKSLWRKILKEDKDLAKEITNFMKDPSTLTHLAEKEFYKLLNSPDTPEAIKNVHDFVDTQNKNFVKTRNKMNEEEIKPYMDYHYDNNKLNYQFALSMWIFIDDHDASTSPAYTRYTPLFSYGNKPTLLYHGAKNELLIQTTSCIRTHDGQKCTPTTAFKTNSILYQRWNHVLMNYDGANLDVFINNHLVGTAPNVVPYMDYETIVVGSENGIHGGICNVVYYNKPVSKQTVGTIYNLFKNDDPPIFKS